MAKRHREPVGGKSRMELLALAQAECVRAAKPFAEDLRDILDAISTPEQRATEFLRSVYGWKSALSDRYDSFRELTVKYRDARQLIYRYIALVQDVQTALSQLRHAMRSNAKQYEIEAHCAILRTSYVRLADMIAGEVFETGDEGREVERLLAL
ncbi:hypothetical protein AM501_06650 [Aneurinibacillus migulanus]|uniref:hypothetical protein n=1 Tax=Aneurinibacillus migulanus TaxID=47500 RepID=UPI0005B95C4A|nr:hypothetical protein [Aneurinibacillus migulanus]KIV55267.1 hypothetical protein TS64_12015 [Aneurinibacillus migulanus]KPD09031.1 hypothetical protein AM501_06650 [Aneurinibacillus migulanus]